MNIPKILLIGIGDIKKQDTISAENLGGKIANLLNKSKVGMANLIVEQISGMKIDFEE